MIDIRHLTHIYPATRHQVPCLALSKLDLSIAAGEFCILSGPNGSGKSTLFQILCGITLPSAGSITVDNYDLLRSSRKIRRITSVVFQNPAVDKHLTVLENMFIHAAMYGNLIRKKDRLVDEALEWSELKGRLHQRVDTLSGGLTRQLELAKCLLTKPKILLLDEPTTGLDPISRRNFLDVLKRIQRDRAITVLMTTHIFAEANEADKVVIMKDGKLLACDTPHHLRSSMGQEMVVIVPTLTNFNFLADVLNRDLGLQPLRFGSELRLEDIATENSLPLLETIFTRYRSQIYSIAIKHAELEDVFIHLTSGTTTGKTL